MTDKIEILIINNDKGIVESLSSLFRSRGYKPFGVYTGQKGLELAYNDIFSLILLDLALPDMDSLSILKKIKGARVSAPIIVIGNSNTVDRVVEAVKLGAFGFIDKPTIPDLVLHTAQNALNQFHLERDMQKIKKALSDQYDIVGRSEIIERFREKIKRIAMSFSRVMFIGEPGSGKKTAAKYIHYSSSRATGAFLTVNCAIPTPEQIGSDLWLESELFGHRKGAFVGANSYRKGKFEITEGGTLFLEEVGALSADLQAKLLRAIESNTIQPVGSTDVIKIDVRIMSSSRVELEPEVKAGRFREDLYFRLNVIPVVVPTLRTHPEDIPLLVRYFLDRAGFVYKRVETKGIELLKSYHWPENIRELKQIIEKAAAIDNDNTISETNIRAAMTDNQNRSGQDISTAVTEASDSDELSGLYQPDMSLRRQVVDLEKRLLAEVYERCNGNITQAAKMLKTDRGNLSKKLKRLGMTGREG